MIYDVAKARSTEHPTIMGTGFIAVDVVFNGSAIPRISSGGSCGNVLTVMSYFGWNSYPIAHLQSDISSTILLGKLSDAGVKLDFVLQTKKGQTPIVVEEISQPLNGYPSHKFKWNCPICGARYPRRKRVDRKLVKRVLENLHQIPDVLYFDRISSATLDLVRHCKERGSLIVFEPFCAGTGPLFRKAVECCHILKYSGAQIEEISNAIDCASSQLEIKTLGADGLKYRLREHNQTKVNWTKIESVPVSAMRDTAGAGDWCTAAIINQIGRIGPKWFITASQRDLEIVLGISQLYSAINCQYEGALGAMTTLSHSDFLGSIFKLLLEGKVTPYKQSSPRLENQKTLSLLCSECRADAKDNISNFDYPSIIS